MRQDTTSGGGLAGPGAAPDEPGYVPEWFEEDARVEPFSKRALTEKLFVCMNWLEMLIETEYDQALEEGRADSPKLLALQEDFGQMAKVLARVVSAVVEAGGVGEAVPFEVPAPGMPQHSSYEVAAVPWP